jgi:hypothetical protein
VQQLLRLATTWFTRQGSGEEEQRQSTCRAWRARAYYMSRYASDLLEMSLMCNSPWGALNTVYTGSCRKNEPCSSTGIAYVTIEGCPSCLLEPHCTCWLPKACSTRLQDTPVPGLGATIECRPPQTTLYLPAAWGLFASPSSAAIVPSLSSLTNSAIESSTIISVGPSTRMYSLGSSPSPGTLPGG